MEIQASVLDTNITSTWRGEGIEEIPQHVKLDVLRTIRQVARRLSVTTHVVFCTRLANDVADNEFFYDMVYVRGRRYVYFVEKEYTVIMHTRDVSSEFIFPLLQRSVLTVLR